MDAMDCINTINETSFDLWTVQVDEPSSLPELQTVMHPPPKKKAKCMSFQSHVQPFHCYACCAVTWKMTNQRAKFEIIKALKTTLLEHAKYTMVKVHLCYRAIKYTVCRHVCAHFSARKLYRLGQ